MLYFGSDKKFIPLLSSPGYRPARIYAHQKRLFSEYKPWVYIRDFTVLKNLFKMFSLVFQYISNSVPSFIICLMCSVLVSRSTILSSKVFIAAIFFWKFRRLTECFLGCFLLVCFRSILRHETIFPQLLFNTFIT